VASSRTIQLAWSADYGSTWRWSSWNFAEFGYLLVMRGRPNMAADAHLPDTTDRPGAVNQFSIYDAPEPWGPWTMVYYTEQWEGRKLKDLVYWEGWGESAHLPSKWMSADGKTVHLVFAGGPGGFSIRRMELTSTIPADLIPSGANTPMRTVPR
jgi:hypothetical protein